MQVEVSTSPELFITHKQVRLQPSVEGVLYRRYNIGLAAVDVKAVKDIVAGLDDNSTLAFIVSACNQREMIFFLYYLSLSLLTGQIHGEISLKHLHL